MTEQEIFNTVCEHLMTQGKPAQVVKADDSVTCAYRTPDGLKCAVGCLISDAEYSPDMEFLGVQTLLNKEMLPSRLAPHVGLLVRLQDAHDATAPRSWPRSLRSVAAAWKLDIPECIR